jgi:CHAT domain-containing protein
MLEYALRLAQKTNPVGVGTAQTTGRCSAALSCLLVGSGGAGLTVRESVQAILRAALDANTRLLTAQLDSKVLIGHIEFVELFEDVAIGSARAVAEALGATEIGKSAVYTPATIDEGAGRRQRRYYDTDRSWDQRIEIEQDPKSGMLKFKVATNRARAEESLATGQMSLADLFVQQASATTSADAEVSSTLFELLLPPSFKDSAPDQRDMVLLVDKDSARFPWELLQDSASRNNLPLAIEAGIVRQFKTQNFRQLPTQAGQDTALVIGNPDLEGDSNFPDLPGARDEATQVRDLLKVHLPADSVKDFIDAKAKNIVAALHRRSWRIVHLAGHGMHEYKVNDNARPVSGMVIGKDVFLTPGDVAQMRYVPELVFINCCHLGKTQTQDKLSAQTTPFARLAANLGTQFIEMGVRAVVCAGWAVDDAAAVTFAKTFYEQLFAGRSFRDAVKAARRKARDDHEQCNTWGAYQCYGDPAWRLVRDGRNGISVPDPAYVSRQELVADLQNQTEFARMQTRRESMAEDTLTHRQTRAIEHMLGRMSADLRESWLGSADVAAAMGFAYGEAMMLKEAIEKFEVALASRQGECPVSVVEQCANFRARLAAAEAAELRANPLSRPEQYAPLAERIQAAIKELALINQRAATPKRWLLMGSASKRLAWVQEDPALRSQALLAMASHYREALDLLGGIGAEAMANWAVACLLLERLDAKYKGGRWHAALAAQVTQQAERSRASNAARPDFWDAVGEADMAVVQLLLAAGDAKACTDWADAAQRGYRAAFARGGSAREKGSVQEHLAFLQALTSAWPSPTKQALLAVSKALEMG